MEKKFSIKDIEKISDICKTKGIGTFEYLGLKIVLGASTDPLDTAIPLTRGMKRKAKIIAEGTDYQEAYNAAQEFTETLHLEDPSAYERAVIEGELGEEENYQ